MVCNWHLSCSLASSHTFSDCKPYTEICCLNIDINGFSSPRNYQPCAGNYDFEEGLSFRLSLKIDKCKLEPCIPKDMRFIHQPRRENFGRIDKLGVNQYVPVSSCSEFDQPLKRLPAYYSVHSPRRTTTLRAKL